jgi:undecaprenyl-diphosphatase
MPLLRHKYTWIPLYAAVAAWFLYRYQWQGLWFVGFTLLTFALCDQLSASLIKPFVERLRPCREPLLEGQVRLLVHCGGGFSFPSSHASNHFGFAVIVGACLYKQYRWPLYALLLVAALVSFAQIYVGVHYPMDVLGGAVLGTSIALLVWALGKKVMGRFKAR